MTSWQCALATTEHRMQYLLESGELSDCEFLIGEEKKSFKAHTLILSMTSPVFYTMFYGEKWKSDVIEIPEVEPKIFEVFLVSIYSEDHLLKSFEEVTGLFYLADKYIIPSLISKCVEFVKTKITIEDVCEAYEIGKLLDSQDLLEVCKKIILNDTESVIKTKGFNNLKKETLIMILEEDQLKISSEYDLYIAVSKWIEADISRQAFIRDDRGNRGQSSNPPSRETCVRRKTPLTTHVPSVEQETPPPPVKATLDPGACKKKSRVIFEEWLANHNVQESVDCIQKSFSDAMQFVQPVLESVLEGKALARTSFGELLAALLSRGIVTSSEVTKELALIIESGEDLMIDVPLVWTCLAELLVPLMLKGVYSFTELKDACEPCRTTYFTRTLAEIFKQLTKEKGPAFIKQQWESSKVQFTDFFPESDVDNFIKTNKCGFLIGEGEVAEAGESLPMDQVEDKLYNLLKSEQNDKIFDHVCEWIKANMENRTQNADFIKALTRAVIKASISNAEILKNEEGQYDEILKYIRFATMTPSNFASGPAIDGFMSKEDSLNILIYLSSPQTNTGYPDKFKKGNWNLSRSQVKKKNKTSQLHSRSIHTYHRKCYCGACPICDYEYDH